MTGGAARERVTSTSARTGWCTTARSSAAIPECRWRPTRARICAANISPKKDARRIAPFHACTRFLSSIRGGRRNSRRRHARPQCRPTIWCKSDNNLLFRLRCGRQQAVQAQVHCSGAVVVGPVVRQRDEREGARSLAAAEQFDLISQLGVVDLAERSVAEIKACLQRLHQLVFAIGFLERHWRLHFGHVTDVRAQIVVRFDDMQNQVSERDLLLGGLVSEFVGRHLFGRRDKVLLLAGKNLLSHGRDWIFVLGENGGGGKEQKNSDDALHGILSI